MRARRKQRDELPEIPFYKDEHVLGTRGPSAAASLRILILAVVVTLAILIFGLIDTQEGVSSNRSQAAQLKVALASESAERSAGHAQRVQDEATLKAELEQQIGIIQAQTRAQFKAAVCTFLAQYPTDATPGLTALRKEFACPMSPTKTPDATPTPSSPKPSSTAEGLPPPPAKSSSSTQPPASSSSPGASSSPGPLLPSVLATLCRILPLAC